MAWPILPGRYVVGDERSNLAICTLSSLDLIDKLVERLGKEKFAIIGKCVTENIGIERMIKNVISNPNIRFILICGKEPKGHWVGQALLSLKENGVDSEGRIIGAKGAMPYLKNVSREEVEQFRRQVEIVDMRECEDVDKIVEKALELANARRVCEWAKRTEEKEETEVIEAWHDDAKEFSPDPKGWFVIDLDRNRGEILVEHYVGYGKEAKLHCRIKGKNAHELCATIARLGLVSRVDHACYLGRELQKAEIALKLGLKYEQDKELEDLEEL